MPRSLVKFHVVHGVSGPEESLIAIKKAFAVLKHQYAEGKPSVRWNASERGGK